MPGWNSKSPDRTPMPSWYRRSLRNSCASAACGNKSPTTTAEGRSARLIIVQSAKQERAVLPRGEAGTGTAPRIRVTHEWTLPSLAPYYWPVLEKVIGGELMRVGSVGGYCVSSSLGSVGST